MLSLLIVSCLCVSSTDVDDSAPAVETVGPTDDTAAKAAGSSGVLFDSDFGDGSAYPSPSVVKDLHATFQLGGLDPEDVDVDIDNSQTNSYAQVCLHLLVCITGCCYDPACVIPVSCESVSR